MYEISAVDIMPELKRNILNFGYGVNFKYEGMLSHSFDRFYVVAKFELPKVEDLRLITVDFDSKCSYLTKNDSYYTKLLKYYLKILPYMEFYKKQIEYYNHTAYKILTNEIGLILHTFPMDNRPKRAAILASVLGGIASSIIGLAYEEIASVLHHKRHKAVKIMERKTDLQHNKIHPLEDTLIMYGVYNSGTLTELIDTVYRMHNTTMQKERTFAGRLNQWFEIYLHQEGMHYYAINLVLYLTSVKEKYMKIYEIFIEELKLYSKVIRILSKGYLPISLLPPSKLEGILSEVRVALAKTKQRL